MSNSITRLFREPLLQFLFIGACIYGAYGLFAPPDESDLETTVVVDANRINAFVAQWKARWNRPPTRQELNDLIDTYIREEILYRQAVAMGLAEDDAVTRRRMAQRLEFLTADLSRVVEPTDEEVQEYFEANLDQFRQPDRQDFLQVFFDPDSRGDDTLADAEKLLAELQAAGVPDPASFEAGDQMVMPNYLPGVSEIDIRRRAGRGFAAAVMELEPGQWHGPVLSGFGVHLVYVLERIQSPAPALAEVRADVMEALQAQRVERFNEEFYQTLRDNYEVIVEDADVPPGSVLNEVGGRTPVAAGAAGS
mgnify:CR=1 FL=1